MTVSRY